MKEETPSKKLPPKLSGPTSTSKVPNDEIFNALLRINNFDSISRESLDIDLSACVTISGDAAAIMNGNSLSSTDFWRVLDENAQTSQLDGMSSNDDSSAAPRGTALSEEQDMLATSTSISGIQNEQPNSFSGTFLRPDPPPTANSLFSPLKKSGKSFEQQHRKIKVPLITSLIDSDKLKVSATTRSIKIEHEPPPPVESAKICAVNNNVKHAAPSMFCGLRPGSSASVATAARQVQTPVGEANREVHDATRVSGALPLYKCIDCDGLLLHGEQELSVHESAAHRILHKCNACDREFEQESGLKKHLKAHRSVETRKDAWKKCPDCGKCLKLGSMWMHRKIHSDNKKYGCDICGQKFVQKINLTHHSRVHTAEKPYECPECQKRFQERSHLQRHQKYHAQTRSYRCEKCGKMYKTERCLKVHNLVHLEQRPFACNVCDKSFISNSKLKQHSNIHTGERPFKCNYCPRDFTNFPNWLKHTRRRHKVDHKTGEHLENIPSYCSKKSAKTLKVQKPTDASTSSETVPVNAPTVSPAKTDEATSKAQIKRKKKTAAATEPSPSDSCVNVVAPAPAPASSTSSTTTSGAKPVKVKRERKQLTPKQVQKTATPTIKQEILDTKATGTNAFPDLHCLSITSAEELIMEQALEMEECGLYDVPGSTVDTDNAMSSETAAAMHFKIKNEFIPDTSKEEEFISLKDLAKTRVLCSSLESSPFSSPASIEFPSSSAISVSNATVVTDLHPTTTTFYMPSSFAFTSQGSLITNISTNASAGNVTTTDSANGTQTSAALSLQSAQIQTQSLFNHLYLPMTVSMPLLVRPNQVLPSVDTLFFSAHANTPNLFHSKTVVASATPPGSIATQQKM